MFYLPQAYTKQKWLDMSFFFACLLAHMLSLLFVCFKVLCTNHYMRCWQIASNPLIAED